MAISTLPTGETKQRLPKQKNGQETGNYPSDPWLYRIVVSGLGIIILVALIGIIYLAGKTGDGAKVPDSLALVCSTAIGALAGWLVPSPANRRPS